MQLRFNLDLRPALGESPNDIRRLVRDHPSIRRIVFSTGRESANLFRKHNRDWLNASSRQGSKECFTEVTAFSKAVFAKDTLDEAAAAAFEDEGGRHIQLVVPYSVSPAAATASYATKRDYWLENVYNMK